jgi:two-component system cell cycle sensor histidine kinase/response regulator CckA
MMTQPLRLLVVEDEESDVALIRDKLGRARGGQPFEIEWVGGLGPALRRLSRKGIDVVLLDLGLPDSGGTDGVMRMAAQAPDVPVVVLTGLDDETVGLRAVQQGAQDYLVKDRVDGPLLDRSLRYAIERKRAESAQARMAAIMGGLCYECGRKLSPETTERRDS